MANKTQQSIQHRLSAVIPTPAMSLGHSTDTWTKGTADPRQLAADQERGLSCRLNVVGTGSDSARLGSSGSPPGAESVDQR